MATSIANSAAGNTSATIGPARDRNSLPVPEDRLHQSRMSTISIQELYAKLHGNRPTSEILRAHYKSPEAEAIDRWFEDLSKYESTLEQMAKAKLDENFREELIAIEKWFIVLSDPERTTALYTLLQHANPVQIRFLLQVLSQMAESITIPATAGSTTSSNGSGTAPMVKRDSSNTTPSPAASPRQHPMSSPKQRTDLDYDPTATRSRRPLYDRHSAPQDGSLGVGLLAFQASMNVTHTRMHSNPAVPTDSDYSNIPGDGYGDRRVSNSSSTSSRAQSPSLRPITPDHTPGAVGDWSPSERSSSLKRAGQGQPAGLGIVGEPVILGGPKATNGYRLADMPLIAPRGNSLTNDEAGVVAAEVANMALASPTSLLATTPTTKAVVNPSGFARSSANSRPLTPIGIRSPASGASSVTPTTQRIAHDLLNISPPHIMSQSSLHSLTQQHTGMMHPGTGWSHIDLARTRGLSGYATSDYSDEQDGFDGLLVANSNIGGMGGLAPEYYGEGTFKGRARNGSIGSGSGHKEKGKIPETMDLDLLNDIPAWLRSLRLHKYTPIFEGMSLKELIKLTDEDLVAKGVTALGARRKLTKVFDMVKQQLETKGVPI